MSQLVGNSLVDCNCVRAADKPVADLSFVLTAEQVMSLSNRSLLTLALSRVRLPHCMDHVLVQTASCRVPYSSVVTLQDAWHFLAHDMWDYGEQAIFSTNGLILNKTSPIIQYIGTGEITTVRRLSQSS